jgi:photosystem II stability/assembly factor-like uncharacterized protein
MSRTARLLPLAVLLALAGPAWAEAPKGGPEPFKHLEFRSIGPAAGGRVARVCGVPGDPLTYYAATAAGGVWKSADGGTTWKPVFDDQPIASMGAVAVAPSDPNVVYAGSGEANIRGNVEPGNGIYKSTDAGKTWKHVWKQEGQVGRIAVHPRNANVAFAAVLGHAFGPNPERGVYRTTDGGKTWVQVLKKDADTGAIDVVLDPNNPSIVFASLWQTRRRPWEMTSGGPGSGLYLSRDGGDTWTQLGPRDPDAKAEKKEGQKEPPGKGLPPGIWGRVGLAVAPSDGRRVYALIEAEKGGLYRSDDGGDSWDLATDHHALRQRPWYFSTITVDPKNPDVVYCPQVRMLKSIDGGKTFSPVKKAHHGDHHDLWIDPRDPKRMIGANDGGVDVSVNGGETWFAPPLPIAQFYHVAADTRVPYHVMGAMQDIGTASGPSNSLSVAGIDVADWESVGGGEAGFVVPDPADPDVVWAGEYGGYVSRYDRRTRQARNVSIYPFNPSGHGAEDLRYRFQWTAPIMVSPHGSHVVYHASNVLFRTTDGGKSWQPVSPDLTRNDRSKQKWSGGPITGDNTGVEVYGTIFAVAESPKEQGVLWAGSDDGRLHVTRDGGKSWEDVGKNVKGLPEWGTVVCVEASPFDAATAYVVVDNHRMDDMRPHLFKTADFGKTWASLSAGLPQDVFLRAVREDPKRRGLLYLGTERGLAFSTNDGAAWQPLKMNLPTVAVTDLVVKNDDLVLSTNGRSLWIFDDLTPIRVYSDEVAKKVVYLFPEVRAVRWRYHTPLHEPRAGSAGANPPPGAAFYYYLKDKPKGDVTLDVLDAQGRVVRTLSSKPEPEDFPVGDPDGPEKPKKADLKTEPGLHRAVWDLRYKGPERIKGAKVDAGSVTEGPLANPGVYTLRLTADGKTAEARAEVRLDPRTEISEGALEAHLKFALEVRGAVGRLAEDVNRLRAVRKQLADRDELLKDETRAADLVKASKALIEKLDALEGKFHNPKAHVAYDILAQKGGAQLYSQLVMLHEFADDSDGPVTQGMREVFDEATKVLAGYEAELAALFKGDLAKLNDDAKKLDLPVVHVPAPAAAKPVTGAALPQPLRGILAEIDLPAPYGVKSEALPEFTAKALEGYESNDKPTTLRAAVSKARETLVEQVKGLSVREEFRARPREADFANEVVRKQKEAARVIGELNEVLDDLKKVGSMRDGEVKRWRADYDFVLARVELELAWLNEYQFALGELRREERPPLDPKEQTGWRLEPAEVSRGDAAARKMSAEAVKLLRKVAEDYPATPWAWFAKRDAAAPLGLTWKAAKVE